jgi:hypothetical protein
LTAVISPLHGLTWTAWIMLSWSTTAASTSLFFAPLR